MNLSNEETQNPIHVLSMHPHLKRHSFIAVIFVTRLKQQLPNQTNQFDAGFEIVKEIPAVFVHIGHAKIVGFQK